jgi:hypothetical protein
MMSIGVQPLHLRRSRMTRDELKEQIANLVVGPPMDCHITDGYWLALQILALPEIKLGLELVK